MSAYILPVLLVVLIVLSLVKRVKVYDCFLGGAGDGLSLALTVFPYIAAVFVAIELFRASGLSSYTAKLLARPFSFLGIPPELAELMLLTPLSGNGAIALLEKLIAEHGADSYIGRCASVVAGASETIFYISAVYLPRDVTVLAALPLFPSRACRNEPLRAPSVRGHKNAPPEGGALFFATVTR